MPPVHPWNQSDVDSGQLCSFSSDLGGGCHLETGDSVLQACSLSLGDLFPPSRAGPLLLGLPGRCWALVLGRLMPRGWRHSTLSGGVGRVRAHHVWGGGKSDLVCEQHVVMAAGTVPLATRPPYCQCALGSWQLLSPTCLSQASFLSCLSSWKTQKESLTALAWLLWWPWCSYSRPGSCFQGGEEPRYHSTTHFGYTLAVSEQLQASWRAKANPSLPWPWSRGSLAFLLSAWRPACYWGPASSAPSPWMAGGYLCGWTTLTPFCQLHLINRTTDHFCKTDLWLTHQECI